MVMKEHYVKNAGKYQGTHQGQQLTENLLIVGAFKKWQVKNLAKYQLVGNRLIQGSFQKIIINSKNLIK